MRKSIFAIATAGLAAVALAAVTVLGARGNGVAKNAAGKEATFGMDVTSVRAADGSVRVGGSFELHTVVVNPNEPPALIGLLMPAAKSFTKQGKYAGFEGPGYLRIKNARGEFAFPGAVTVRVADRRDGDVGDPDQLAVRFVATRGPNFEWTGNVSRGGLLVYEAHRN